MADDGDEEKTKSFTALTDMDMGTILNGRGSDLTKYQNLSSEIMSESSVRRNGAAHSVPRFRTGPNRIS